MSTQPDDRRPIRRALVSVYDKTGLEELARGAARGRRRARLDRLDRRAASPTAGVPVTKVEELTGFPECLDGRVKTLHPQVHAGILADLRLETHRAQLAELGVEPFDLVVSNLYPFTETVASGATPDECVEQIDIGGPSMVRAAAKNHPSVAVVTSPGAVRRRARRRRDGGFTLAAAAAAGRRGVRAHRDVRRGRRVLDGQRADRHHRRHRLPGLDRRDLGQGGGAALRREPAPAGGALPALARRAWPRPSSCTARRCPTTTTSTPTPPAARPTTSTSPAVAIIKHANPCGIAVGADVAEAHRKAHACDPVSAFGGVIAVNRPVSRRDGRAGRRDLHRGRRRPRLRGRRGRGAVPQEEHPGAALPGRRHPRPGRVPRDQRRRCCCSTSTTSTPVEARRRPVDLDAGHRRAGRRRERSPTSPSPGGPAAR